MAPGEEEKPMRENHGEPRLKQPVGMVPASPGEELLIAGFLRAGVCNDSSRELLFGVQRVRV